MYRSLLIVIGLLLAMGCAGAATPTPTSTPTPAPTATATPTATPTPAPTPTPTLTPTPEPTATATSTPTPVPPTATPTPRPTPTPTEPLETTTRANLWIYIEAEQRSYGVRWEVYADPAFDIDRFDLSVYIDRQEFCNADPIYGDLSAVQLGCESYEPRGSTPEMYATVGRGFGVQPAVLICAKNVASTQDRLIYACNWRN